jgi:hypothetical protein
MAREAELKLQGASFSAQRPKPECARIANTDITEQARADFDLGEIGQ